MHEAIPLPLDFGVTDGLESVHACLDCGDNQPLHQFRRHPTSRLGYQLICTSCSTAAVRRSRGVDASASYLRPSEGEPCGICGRSDTGLFLDHDHYSGRFRGWLCRSCNAGVGYFGDDPELLRSAIRYLVADY